MTPDTRNGSAQKIALQIQEVLLEVGERFPLGDIVGEFVEETQPVLAVLPVGETGHHDGNLKPKSAMDKGG